MAAAPDYMIASASSVVGLESRVIELMAHGWRLVGGIATLPPHEGHGAVFYQALTKGGKSA